MNHRLMVVVFFFLGVFAFDASGMQLPGIIAPDIAYRLKYGPFTEKIVRPSLTIFMDDQPFAMRQFWFSRFNQKGNAFGLAKQNRGYIFLDTQGSLVTELTSNIGHGPELGVVNIKSEHFADASPLIQDYFINVKKQTLSKIVTIREFINVSHDISVSIEYSKKKSDKEMFIFEDPTQNSQNAHSFLFPTYSEGVVCAITSLFPLGLKQGARSNGQFNSFVLNEIEKNKHVCLYEVKEGKLKLLRNLGNHPYCVGAYMNPQKTMVALLYGAHKGDVKKCLKFICIHEPTLFDVPLAVQAKSNFSDVLVRCYA